VPSNLGIFLNHPEVEKCTSLRTVLCGGEPLTGDLQDLFFDRLDAELYNVYGPTEAAIDVTYWKCEPDRRYPMIPIGRVLPNTQIHILDDRLAPVPIGVVGELHVGGVQVARGYVNRPDLTAERFIPDPFSPDPDARLYKSGDLARFMADGNIEFLGRRDHQVKIRGFRIELGEIEATLMQHPSIANAAVVISGADRSNERIFAYVTTRDGSVDEVAVRDFLKRKLPRYMVPARVVVIEKIPVTTSGKIDRNALPLPERSGEHFGFAHVAPRTPLERDIAAVWSEVLGVDDIGVHDDIFDLGGHSLDAMRVNARISEMLQVDLSLLAFFESPTIEGQALAVTRAMASQLLGEEELEAMVADLGAGDARPEGRLTP
jgi:acyl-CoA synthetase (AMP-forming)/AMP-acid ligase II